MIQKQAQNNKQGRRSEPAEL